MSVAGDEFVRGFLSLADAGAARGLWIVTRIHFACRWCWSVHLGIVRPHCGRGGRVASRESVAKLSRQTCLSPKMHSRIHLAAEPLPEEMSMRRRRLCSRAPCWLGPSSAVRFRGFDNLEFVGNRCSGVSGADVVRVMSDFVLLWVIRAQRQVMAEVSRSGLRCGRHACKHDY